MRARSNWLFRPKVKATWVAIAAGSLAGLAVFGACSDAPVSKVGGPSMKVPEPRLYGAVGGFAHLVKVCVDASSTPGTYNFAVAKRTTNPGISRPFELPPPAAPDPDPGPQPPATYTQTNLGPYTPGDALTTAPSITIPANATVPVCVTVFQRDDTPTHANNRMQNTINNGLVNPYAVVNVTLGALPPNSTYNALCSNDDPLLPQTPNCAIPAAWSNTANYSINQLVTFNQTQWKSLQNGNQGNTPAENTFWTAYTFPPIVANPIYSAANVFHGSTITYHITVPPQEPPPTCVLGYPFTSSVALTSTIFNESSVLSSFGRGPKPGDATIDQIRVWATDEHALTLGLRASIQKNAGNVLVPTNYTPFSAFPTNLPQGVTTSSASPVGIGSTATTGAGAAIDGAGRPLYPALFVTDITGITDQSTTNTAVRLGDWQYGGTPIAPDGIWGTWKGAFRTFDNTKNPTKVTLDVDDDPAKNHKDVGPGGVNPGALAAGDASPATVQDLGYSAEIVWNINALKTMKFPPVGGNTDQTTWQYFDPSVRSYRLQFMVHDGDQNKTGGDVGQACMNIGPGSTANFARLREGGLP